jgi:hypothetical protein
VIIRASATGTNGFYYREEHEWRNLAPEAGEWFGARLAEIMGYAEKIGANKSDGDITATLNATVDGIDSAPFAASSITRRELKKFQRMFAKVGDDLLKLGE